ncbi:MAG: 50S ribosomal protein L17 [Spirochaetes bacterium]|nr:50S ribosomal protein L17 [Spirochaetota bacterium]
MRHLKKRNKLSRTSSHRNAILVNLCKSIIINGRIRTTKTKAKMVQPIIEKMITRAKVNTLHNKRIIASRFGSWDIIPKLFDQIGPKFKERPGGYTRVIKIGFRNSDGAEMALLEFLEEFKDISDTKDGNAPAVKGKSSKSTDSKTNEPSKTPAKKAKKLTRGKKKEKSKKIKDKKKAVSTRIIKKKTAKKKVAKKKSAKKKAAKKKAPAKKILKRAKKKK